MLAGSNSTNMHAAQEATLIRLGKQSQAMLENLRTQKPTPNQLNQPAFNVTLPQAYDNDLGLSVQNPPPSGEQLNDAAILQAEQRLPFTSDLESKCDDALGHLINGNRILAKALYQQVIAQSRQRGVSCPEADYRHYLLETGIENKTMTFKCTLEAADKENKGQARVNAQYWVGLYYRDGYGVAQNDDKAVEYLIKAANGGNPHASASLSDMFLVNRGINEQTKLVAHQYLAKATQSHSKQAHCQII